MSTQNEQQILDALSQNLALLKEGQFIQAMNEHLADDVQLIEGNNAAKVGKAHCIQVEEEMLSTVTEFIRYELISGPPVAGNTSFYEAIMEFVTNDGTKHKFEQVVRSTWRDGKIIEERFYHV